MKTLIWIVVLLGCVTFSSWSKVTHADDRAGIEFFEAKIRPVLVKHCYECHSTEAGKSRGGLKVDTQEAMRRGGDSGPALGGRPAGDSLLYQSITYEGDYQMPPQGKLPDAVIADVRRWIEMGAPDPRVTKTVPDARTEIDVASGRDFWAYRSPNNGNSGQCIFNEAMCMHRDHSIAGWFCSNGCIESKVCPLRRTRQVIEQDSGRQDTQPIARHARLLSGNLSPSHDFIPMFAESMLIAVVTLDADRTPRASKRYWTIRMN